MMGLPDLGMGILIRSQTEYGHAHVSGAERAGEEISVVVAYGSAVRPVRGPAFTNWMRYLHGGFWRLGVKEDSARLAATFVPAGWNFITVEYPLRPGVPFVEIVRSAHNLVDALPSIAAAQNIVEPRFVLNGNSAGAQLAATAAAHLDGAIAGLILLCGVYELAPFLRTAAKTWLQLTAAEAERFGPAKISP